MGKITKDSLGDRMKTYEAVPKNYLTRRTPVIIRIDGCHFHTFTRSFAKPFDEFFSMAMAETMKNLCENIQNVVLGYTQSDEITLVMCDYKNIDTSAWFDNQVQKICSVSAALATLFFQRNFIEQLNKWQQIFPNSVEFLEKYYKALDNGAYFDARCFNIPKEEVCNNLIWRQQDCVRNSIQSLSQSLYSHKELQGLNCKQLQDKMFTEKGINWNDLATYLKRGSCAIKKPRLSNINGEYGSWTIDFNIPIFTQDRAYIEDRINFK